MFATKTRKRKNGSNNKITISSAHFFHPRLLVKLVLGWNLISFLHAPLSIACSWRCTAFRVSQTNQLSNRCKKFNYCFTMKVFLRSDPHVNFWYRLWKLNFIANSEKSIITIHESRFFHYASECKEILVLYRTNKKHSDVKEKLGKNLFEIPLMLTGVFYMLIRLLISV